MNMLPVVEGRMGWGVWRVARVDGAGWVKALRHGEVSHMAVPKVSQGD